MLCLEPKSACTELEEAGVQAPGNAPGLSSLVVGEKTLLTSSSRRVQPGGGSCFFAAQADTDGVRRDASRLQFDRQSYVRQVLRLQSTTQPSSLLSISV